MNWDLIIVVIIIALLIILSLGLKVLIIIYAKKGINTITKKNKKIKEKKIKNRKEIFFYHK